MNSIDIEIKEILSKDVKLYNSFLDAALAFDEESLIITRNDQLNASFPTKDREDSFTLGAYEGEVLTGVISFVRDGENREKLRHKGLISTMYVANEFRGMGIAGKLLDELIKRVKAVPGIDQVNLIVVADNTPAKKLYEKYGFKRYGTEHNSIKWKGKYSDEDLMVLRLKRS